MSLSKSTLPRSPGLRRAGLKHLAAALAVVALASGTASADLVISYGGPELTGAQQPAGPGPYATATLSNYNNGVLFTIDNKLIGTQEFITQIAFNYLSPPSPDASGLAASYVSGNAFETSSFGTDTTVQGAPLGTFTLGYSYPTSNSNPDPNQNRFEGGEQSVVFVYHTSGAVISTSDFATPNQQGYLSAIHVQGIGTNGNGSGKLGGTEVPEPASFATVGIGTLLGLGYAWRRRKRAVV